MKKILTIFSLAIVIIVPMLPRGTLAQVPKLYRPANGWLETKSSVTFIWEATWNSITKHQLQVDDNSDFSSPEFTKSTNRDIVTTTIHGLLPSKTYYWRVRSLCTYYHAEDWSNWSSPWSFVTDCWALESPIMSSPVDSAYDIDCRQVNLMWESIAGAVDYSIQVANDTGFTNIVSHSTNTISPYSIDNTLDADTTYFWRVATNHDCTTSEWSAAWKFTTLCPYAEFPLSLSPSNGISIVINPINPIVFDWSDVSEATKYNIQIDNNPAFGSIEAENDSILDSQYFVSSLSGDMFYYWRVQSHNGCQWSDWSSTAWVFVSNCPTDISISSHDWIPNEFGLKQNYPNPFNPSTTIKYNLQKSNNITLKIYNLSGKEIKTLVNGFKIKGEHEITWQPKGLASGIYYYRLQAGDFSETKKLILQK